MLVPTALSPVEVAEALTTLPGWRGDATGLTRRLVFEEFRGAMAFMAACVEGIEQLNQHPAWCNKYNSIDIRLLTFDIGGKVTSKDINLAHLINSVLFDHGSEFGLVEED